MQAALLGVVLWAVGPHAAHPVGDRLSGLSNAAAERAFFNHELSQSVRQSYPSVERRWKRLQGLNAAKPSDREKIRWVGKLFLYGEKHGWDASLNAMAIELWAVRYLHRIPLEKKIETQDVLIDEVLLSSDPELAAFLIGYLALANELEERGEVPTAEEAQTFRLLDQRFLLKR